MRGSLVPRSRAFTVHLPFIAGLAVVAAVGSAALSALPAAAVQASQATLVSPVPAPQTPDVNDGRVNAIAQVGDEIILGGTFTSVSPAGDLSTTYPLANTLAFDATTGDLDTTGYLPSVNGEVDTAIAGPAPDEVYLGGKFTTVDGRPMAVALVSTRTGQLVPTWHPSALNGSVSRLVLAGGHLFVAGTFTKAGADRHGGLVALDPATGHATSYVNFSFTGHHNYGSQCDPDTSKCATGRVGVKAIDVNPAGTHLVVIGDFTEVAGFSRDQIAMLNLGTPSATVDASWATLAYTSPCLAHSFDSYVRDVQFSPDGGYFVVTATGGIGTNRDGTKSSCDAAARYETNASGANVRPTWIDYTGEDSLWTVALTGTAIYVGGHERWLNNSLGQNQAGPGAVPRPGIAALSPSNGLPLSWNPGREPRGAGCFALLATPAGLWIGSDTDYIGNRTYLRERVAFFPLAGGVAVPDASTAPLPGQVYPPGTASTYTTDPDRLIYREFNGVTLGAEEPVSSGLPLGSVDGAFTVDGEVIYGKPDGSLYERRFDGSTFGDEVQVDPYDDPLWDDVQTGSGEATKDSHPRSRLRSRLSRPCSSGTVVSSTHSPARAPWIGAGSSPSRASSAPTHSPSQAPTTGPMLPVRSSPAESCTTRAARMGGWAVPWSGLKPAGVPTLVDAATDWASRGLLLLAQSDAPVATPTAEFTATCNGIATCSFDAMPYLTPTAEWSATGGTSATARASAFTLLLDHPYLHHRWHSQGDVDRRGHGRGERDHEPDDRDRAADREGRLRRRLEGHVDRHQGADQGARDH